MLVSNVTRNTMRRVKKSAFSVSRHTIGLCAGAGRDLASLLEVDVPAGLIAARVLECEGVDAVALLDGVLAIGIAGVDGRLDGVEGGRGGKLVCYRELVSIGLSLRRRERVR